MNDDPRIAILGSGAMGSLFGGLLAANGEDVTLIDTWGDHVRSIDAEGLYLRSADGDRTIDVPATTDPSTVGAVDLVIVFVKSHQTRSALDGAPSLLADDPSVLTLQNGLGNPETIAEFVREANVVAGVTAHGATLDGPGRVFHAGEGPTTVGRYYGANDGRVEAIARMLSDAGIETTVSDAVRDDIWRKVLVNVGINAPTALAGVRNGLLAATDPGRRLVAAAVDEALRVARSEGRDVGSDVRSHVLDVASRTGENRSSMLQDVGAGRETEIEHIHGAIVERAEANGIEAPVNRTLADLVRLVELDADERDR